ncbi:hypothetical protein E6H11_09105 [Candidatus Bathyarchaeota archaeon]|nr:MAG: hypothetical protein E6H11_09105 [Candidatus Bathyarchaeota archaeon]
MQIDSGTDTDRIELLANIKRLTRIVLDKLEEGSKEGPLDPAQARLYGSIATRSLCLWLEARSPRPRRRVGRDLHDEIDRLYREMTQEKARRGTGRRRA